MGEGPTHWENSQSDGVTTAVLEINAPRAPLLIRQTLIEEGGFPPKEPG